MSIEEIAVMLEACNASGSRNDIGFRASKRIGSDFRVILAATDRLLKLDYLRTDGRSRDIEATPRGRQGLREATAVLENLVRDSNLLRYQT